MLNVTSREAYADLKENDKLNPKEREVMAAFKSNQTRYTRQQISEAIGMPLGSVCGRVKALTKKGELVVLGYQAKTETTKRREILGLPNPQPWVVAAFGRGRNTMPDYVAKQNARNFQAKQILLELTA